MHRMVEQTTLKSTENTTAKLVNLVVAGRTYSVNIHPSEEEDITAAISMVNQRIDAFKKQHPAMERQDFLAMTLITIATELTRIQQSGELATLTGDISARVSQIDKILSALGD